MAGPALKLDTSFDPQHGQAVELRPGLVRVTAPNATPYTFTGTNSYLIGRDELVIVDPGPDLAEHFGALTRAIGRRNVSAILLTHTHRDHSRLARRLGEATGAPLWFAGPHRLSRPRRRFEINGVARSSDWGLVPDRRLADGEVVRLAGERIEVIATPGHCANHLAFGLPDQDVLLSGDHVMGWNSTLVSVPDGSMSDYLASLRKLIDLPFGLYLPGHGGPIADGREQARALLAHREMRNQQIVEAVRSGARTSMHLLHAVYPALKPGVVPAALMTLKAHVEYLEGRGDIRVRRGPLGLRLAPA